MNARKKVGVLISGRGSNLAALIEACRGDDYPAEIAIVISNRPGAEGLELASAAGIAAIIIDHKASANREIFESRIGDALVKAGVELVCCAGFMRLLTESFVASWHDRILNIHPSLLPSYRGLDPHERVLRDGGRISGCSVHFMRAEMDSGPIVAQAAVPVLSDDTPDRLAARVLKAEHMIYPLALKLVAGGRVQVLEERVVFKDHETATPPLISPWPCDQDMCARTALEGNHPHQCRD
ncbi:MAG: phosphoribosylglycinamide formyltransferase [Hyphomicrobiales bacterium]